MAGLERALPKGEIVLVPFFCDVFVGEPLCWNGSRKEFMSGLEAELTKLQEKFRETKYW
jgi:hypothetical protein